MRPLEVPRTMNSIGHKHQNFNPQGKPAPDILSTFELIELMAAHHQDEALSLVELAQWHQEQAEALAAERAALATDVDAVWREAEGLL